MVRKRKKQQEEEEIFFCFYCDKICRVRGS